MLQNLKLVLVAIACFLIGGISFYAWSDFVQTQQYTDEIGQPEYREILDETEETTELAADKKMVNRSTTDAEIVNTAPLKGTISGSLGYPSSGIPPLAVYAFNKNDFGTFFKVETQLNQQTFTIDAVDTGTYVVVAYPLDMPGLAGGYTQAVACGLSVECTDHSLVPVVVEAGEIVTGVEIKDWYAPEGTFPKRP